MFKKLVLIIIIIVPYLLLINLIHDYTEHMEFDIKSIDEIMEASYFLGCVETKALTINECHDRAKDHRTKV